MRIRKLGLIAVAALWIALAAPGANAQPPQATANLVEANAAILVEVFGDQSNQVSAVILVTPEGEEIRAQSISRDTQTQTRTTTTNSGGGGPTVGVGVGTGWVNRQGHRDHSYNSVGIGIGIPLFGGSGQTTETETVTTTTITATVVLPQPIHYLQLWQDYRLEVVYQENGVEKVLSVPTPRPRGG